MEEGASFVGVVEGEAQEWVVVGVQVVQSEPLWV